MHTAKHSYEKKTRIGIFFISFFILHFNKKEFFLLKKRHLNKMQWLIMSQA